MFEENHSHEQEKLQSPLKDLPPGPKKKLKNHWSTHFYQHLFTQIDEEKFAVLYHDGYSRPNKPVNELISLEIIKHLKGLTDKELEDAYIFDHAVRNALGKETLGDNISPKTFTNFRRRLVKHEEKTGKNLLQEVFREHRDHLMNHFNIDGTTQRTDSTFIEANIKNLTRLDLTAKVLHNFLNHLPKNQLQKLPEKMQTFAEKKNLNLSYKLKQGEVENKLETLLNHTNHLAQRFKNEEPINQHQTYTHLQRILDEQTHQIPELEKDDDNNDDEEDEDLEEEPDENPEWKPIKKPTQNTNTDNNNHSDSSNDDVDPNGEEKEEKEGELELKEPSDIESNSLQNPHDEDATYQRKNTEHHQGYKANLTETCGNNNDNPFRVITAVQLDTNNTEDTQFLEKDVKELAEETGLKHMLNDGGFSGKNTEEKCRNAGVTQHFSGIKGRKPTPEKVSLADAEFNENEMTACPQGHQPYQQEFTSENERYWGRMKKTICGNCPLKEECFVEEKQRFYSYGFYQRRLEVAKNRAKLDDPSMQELLNLRAGAESMINEIHHKTGKQTRYTGKTRVKNSTTATAIARNIKRTTNHLQKRETPEQTPT